MKKNIGAALAALVVACFVFRLTGQTGSSSITAYEYATIRWDGRENTALIRPNGKIEPLRPVFQKFKIPEHVDERAFYMTIAINAAAKEGFELVATGNADEWILRRTVNGP